MPERSPELFKFARLTPLNIDAIRCFTRTFVDLVARNDDYHLQFCVSDVDRARCIGRARDKLFTRVDAAGRSGSPDIDPAAFELLEGFYELSLEEDKLPAVSSGWRVGRGKGRLQNRGVEMLMMRSDDHDTVSILHCRFRLHPRTGVLLMRNTTRDHTVSYQYQGERTYLAFGQERPLCQRETRIHIGNMQFLLEYTVPSRLAQQGDFIQVLHDVLIAGQDEDQDPPMTFGFLPGDTSSSLQKHFLFSPHTRAFGGFGWIHAALSTETGDPVAIKTLEVRRQSQHDEAVHEASIWNHVNGTPGILPLHAQWCEHGESVETCNQITERVYFASPLGRFDFSNKRWQQIPWRDQLTLLRQTLEGLDGLHKRGIMHRDVSNKNMLVMSLKPPSAVIHDLGKAVHAPSATDKRLGPLPWVAPEVNGDPYDKLIDAWSWAFSIIYAFGYLRSQDVTNKVTPSRIGSLHLYLDRMSKEQPELEGLADLLRKMISWDPKQRTGVAEALDHTCWQACSDHVLTDKATAAVRPGKRTKLEPEDGGVANGRLVAVAAPAEQSSTARTEPTQLLSRSKKSDTTESEEP